MRWDVHVCDMDSILDVGERILIGYAITYGEVRM
jgi:hypothetical protein